VVYEPGGSKKGIVSSEETLSPDGKAKFPGMDDYESCLVINIGKIIEKVGD
jgi:hypothetical protein